MSVERAAMRGKLSDAQDRRRKLALRIEGLARGVRTGLNTALTPAEELAVPELAEQMDALVAAWGELQATLSEIERLERELR